MELAEHNASVTSLPDRQSNTTSDIETSLVLAEVERLKAEVAALKQQNGERKEKKAKKRAEMKQKRHTADEESEQSVVEETTSSSSFDEQTIIQPATKNSGMKSKSRNTATNVQSLPKLDVPKTHKQNAENNHSAVCTFFVFVWLFMTLLLFRI